jgi:prolyl oligopeptidase PreP (S9A serine peptidase family)
MPSLNNFVQDAFVRRFYLKLVIIFFILAVLVVGAWYGYGEIQKELKAQERPKIQKLNSLRSQVKFLQQQVKLYYQYGDKYQELVKKGLVKQQDRVFWTDSLIKIKDEYIIPEMSFTFSAEKPLSSSQFATIKLPNGMFYYSDVKLQMSLQHEEDLVRVFETISQNVSPLYLVNGCDSSVKQSGHEIEANFDLALGNVSVECSLIIFHTHDSDKNKAK